MADILFKTFKNDIYENIFAIGDIHGDIGPLVICLRDCCKVIRKKSKYNFKQNEPDNDLVKEMLKEWNDLSFSEDLNYEWCGENSIVVFCGDILDNVRGNIEKKPQEFPFEEARVLKFINAINKKAMKENGRLYKVLGNHDMFNLNGRTKTDYNSFVSNYAKSYPGYFNGANGRLDYFCKGKPGAKLLGEDGAYIFLMIKDFIFVHGGISSNLLNYDNIVTANEDLMKYINDPSNITFDEASINNSNLLTLSPMSDDGLVMDRFFGFKKEDITEEEMCTSLYNKFKSLCRELVNEYKNYSEIELNKYSNLPSFPICNPNNMKLVIGHCNQNDVTNEQNKIYKSTFRTLISSNSIDSFPYNEEYGKSVVTDETESSKGIYGITTSCGNRDTNLVIDKNNPSIFRIDVGMARGFNSREYSETYLYSRSPQVLKIDYNDLFTPTITIVKSTFKNSLVHLKDWGVNPYTKKYLKYKNKYLQLKKMKNNLI
jgi:hypothetical protein